MYVSTVAVLGPLSSSPPPLPSPPLLLQMSTSLAPGVRGEPLNALMAEEKVVFGIIAYHPLTKTVAELGKTYSTVDVATIAREVCVCVCVCACVCMYICVCVCNYMYVHVLTSNLSIHACAPANVLIANCE